MPQRNSIQKVYIDMLARIQKRGGSININQVLSKTEKQQLVKLALNGFLSADGTNYTITAKGTEAAQAYKPPVKDVPDHIP